ncbi:hypothetical protein SAMN03159443_04287 [Pseudomonas sp. NFACC15-1]|uniref:DUF6311 domain-containing protein n=1 Tax=unclassified Pseudomonas TaxID=196821 RepID=UPI000888BF98|nr:MULTISPECIES: DUF6311 domain-containing protein [unclassified Pseudomonas]SDA89637.1 hypothetical protein SAMN03159443_04287 [Pseudomonas sp. NFACC15-1]SDW12171.1 hypothetical protein SAMN03159380_00070 [Pseudomonas sp. NFACC14]
MKPLGKGRALNFLPLLIGALAFFMVIGPRALDPQNIAWLGNGDPATHYLGWSFFRQSPWSFPIGLNPSYGLELSNSIVFSDSNPLLAFVFKPFASLLPEPFQYFGIWLLACFMLQAWFAWKLVGLITPNITVAALGAALFLFVPPMILRMTVHLSLGGHFLILAALYLNLHPALRKRRLAWGGLLAVAALIHAYLLAMIALIWLADLAAKCSRRRLSFGAAVVELGLLFSLVTLCCWQAGYFTVERAGVSSDGFGLYRANVLTLFNPQNWSYALKNLPGALGDGDGFAFLGAGLIVLSICAFAGWLRGNTGLGSALYKRPMLGLVLVGLTLFSFSNHVAIGSFELGYSLPPQVISIANIFRASGRMFWPMYYVVIFIIIFLIVRAHTPRIAAYLLGAALLIQVFDTHSGWSDVRKKFMVKPASEWATPFVDPFWKNAAAHYQKIRWVVPQNLSPHWLSVSAFAALHHLPTDAVYLGRMSTQQWRQADEKATLALTSGKYEPDSLYLMDNRAMLRALGTVDTSADLFARIDGFTVLAPGWKQCRECPQLTNEQAPTAAPLELGHTVRFDQRDSGTAYLAKGWADAEQWGTWSEGTYAEIVWRATTPVHSVRLEASAFLAPGRTQQKVIVLINGQQASTHTLDQSEGNILEIPVTPTMQQRVADQGFLKMQLQFADAISPQQLGLGDDARVLAVGLKAMTVN